jgi:hypothetical protein
LHLLIELNATLNAQRSTLNESQPPAQPSLHLFGCGASYAEGVPPEPAWDETWVSFDLSDKIQNPWLTFTH